MNNRQFHIFDYKVYVTESRFAITITFSCSLCLIVDVDTAGTAVDLPKSDHNINILLYCYYRVIIGYKQEYNNIFVRIYNLKFVKYCILLI